jgi:hypothetical protein
MATRLGTAYVDVQPDFSAFDRLVAQKLGRSFTSVGERSGRDFSKGFNDRASGVLVPIAAGLRDVARDSTAANAGIRRTAKALDANAGSARTAASAVAAVSAEVAALSDLTPSARLDFKIAAADDEIAALRAKLATLTAGAQTVTVRADTRDAIIELERVEASKRRLTAQRETIGVDVDKSLPGTLSRISSSVQQLASTMGGGLGNATTRVSAGFLSFGASLSPLVGILAAVAVAIGVALVGALAALAASLALAAGGVAALAAAVVGVLGPAVALAVAVISRLVAVFGALKAQDAAADAVGRGAAAGAQAAAAAADQQAAAARGLTEANRQLGRATAAAYREMEDAAEAASDAIRGLEQAKLSREQADLNTDKAIADLAELRAELGATGDAFGATFDKFTDVAVDTSGLQDALNVANSATGGTVSDADTLKLRQAILDVRQARLSEKEAIDGVSDAETARSRAQQRANEFAKQGIDASEGYSAALRGVEAASLAVVAAQRDQGTDLLAAQAKALDLTNDLSAGELRLLDSIKKVRTELRGAFKPATEAAFGGLNTALLRVPALVNPLRPMFTKLGEAVGSAFDTLSGDIIRPDSIAKLKAFTDGMARLTGPLTDGLSHFLDILTDIGRAALPFLISGTEKVAEKLGEWAKATGNTEALGKSIGKLVGHTKTWLGVAGSIANVFLAFLPTAAADGKSLAQSIKDVADRTTRWLKSAEGQEKVRDFFRDVIPLARDVTKLVVDISKAFVQVGQVLAPVISFLFLVHRTAQLVKGVLLELFTAPQRAIGQFVGLLRERVSDAIARIPQGAKQAAVNFGRDIVSGLRGGLAGIGDILLAPLRRAWGVVLDFFGVRSPSRLFADLGRDLVAGLVVGIRSVAGRVTDAMTSAVNQAVSAIDSLLGRVRSVGARIGRGIVSGIRSGLEGLAGLGKTILNALVDVLNRGMRVVNRALPDKIVLNNAPDINLPDNPLPDSIPRFATGGLVRGARGIDKIPALLTDFEFVNKAAIVRHFGPTVFADINDGKLDPRVGYQAGQRPSVSVTTNRSGMFATGGLVARGATAVAERPNVTVTAPVTVAGGAPGFDPVDAGVKLARVIETRLGGDPGR